MQKLQRFFILSLVFILFWIVGYAVIPSIAFIFGGSFLIIAQHPAYIFFIGIVALPAALGSLFYECFNSNFYTKK
jgi:hypothetical protein